MLGKGSYDLTNSVGIVEDMANRAREWKSGLLVPDYIDYLDLPYETPTAERTLSDIVRERSEEVNEKMAVAWLSAPKATDEFVLTDSRKDTIEDDFWDSPLPVGQTMSVGNVLRTIVDYNPNTSIVTLADTPNLDKTPPEMLELDQLTPAPTPNIRHRKMQLD